MQGCTLDAWQRALNAGRHELDVGPPAPDAGPRALDAGPRTLDVGPRALDARPDQAGLALTCSTYEPEGTSTHVVSPSLQIQWNRQCWTLQPVG